MPSRQFAEGFPAGSYLGFISMTLVGELVCFGHGEVGDTSTIRSGDEASAFSQENLG